MRALGQLEVVAGLRHRDHGRRHVPGPLGLIPERSCSYGLANHKAVVEYFDQSEVSIGDQHRSSNPSSLTKHFLNQQNPENWHQHSFT